jgi:hypothetical protein
MADGFPKLSDVGAASVSWVSLMEGVSELYENRCALRPQTFYAVRSDLPKDHARLAYFFHAKRHQRYRLNNPFSENPA